MSPSFQTISHGNQLAKLRQADHWLQNLGIDSANTRFSEILWYIETIVEFEQRNELQQLVEQYDNAALWYALVEGLAFICIYEAFEGIQSHVVQRSLLKKMLGGPFLPQDESPQLNNIHSRNALYAMEMAAILTKAGMQVKGFDDVDFLFSNKVFNAQCKRIHSSRKIEDNVKKAADQIYQKMRSNPNVKGVICLSIDKIVGKDGMFLRVDDVREIAPVMEEHTRRFIDTYHYTWHNLLNTNILGTVVSLNVVARVKQGSGDFFTRCLEVDLDVIAREDFAQLSDKILIMEFGQRLKEPKMVATP